MRCSVVAKHDGGYEQVQLNAVYGSESDENRSYATATPSAKLDITITNKDAFGAFVPGECYYVDFTPAPAK